MSNKNSGDYDIIVVGAGLIGSSLAALLASSVDSDNTRTHKIAVIESTTRQTINAHPNQRVVALGRIATDILKQLTVFDQLGSAFCYPYQRMHVWDENSNGKLLFDACDHGQTALGHMVDSSQASICIQAQLEQYSNIDVLYECQPQSLSHQVDSLNDKARLTIKDRDGHVTHLSARLVVAADGVRSWVRQQAGIFANHHAYQQQGIVARISCECSHHDTAWQRFLGTGPIAVLPIESDELGPNQGSIVWSADDARADELMALDPNEFEHQLALALENRLGHINLLSQRRAFALKSQQAERYYAGNIVLVGDAAHSIHPLAGQGANLGFKDIHDLVSLIGNKSLEQLSLPKLLSRYQTRRLGDNLQTDRLMSALQAAYQNNASWWALARGTGMNWLSQSGALKHFLAKQAMGL